ncbi:hypothetical protein [Parvularcula lutaonensis]|uniref:Uncharacterized protein n=1 Tax=Parvularcula lutaonensis TaxID=491923 RepID=A0ABV7MCD3_9PROT|nr:hypothetical protein [Parvularcula lutaonensis]GGY49777.1 hypothetical protein GCM10007148_18020 [Parvularcula lutaonensis]
MSERKDSEEKKGAGAAFDLAAAVIAFGFVWLVLDNVALGILAALIVGGGSRVARGRKEDS